MRRRRLRAGARGAGTLTLLAVLIIGALAVVHHRRKPVSALGALARRDALANLVRREPTAANFGQLGEADAALGRYEDARVDFVKAAIVYRSKGLFSEGYVAERLSQRYEVQVQPYIHQPSKPPSDPVLAKFEPAYGCYAGAFIDHEDSIRGTYRDEYQEWRRDASAFNHLTNTHHAIFFMYLGYGRKFPRKFVRHMNDNGAAAQIAWEPDTLDMVRDDGYLHAFARAARRSRTPIFLRFASEMNGDWVPYHGDPARYIEKFRLVAQVMHAEAPNVAMVWCPFEIPVRPIPDYYPGPDAVDWVGINIYSVPFWDNDRRRPAEWRNPADSLRYVYNRYASRHPIMICEYAASHRCSMDARDLAEFAQTKMAQLYSALPRRYPRVKAVCWLSMNAIKHAIPGRQHNDYSLLGDDRVRNRYSQLLRDPYFLPVVSRRELRGDRKPQVAPQATAPLADGVTIPRPTSLSAWVKLYDDHPLVIWRVNGIERLASSLPGPHRWVFDPRSVPEGPNQIELEVRDEAGRRVADITRRVLVVHSPSLRAKSNQPVASRT